MAQFHTICNRNSVRQSRGKWIHEIEKIIADAAFDSLPGEDGPNTVALSERTTLRLSAWVSDLVLLGDSVDIDQSIRDFVMAVVVAQVRNGLTGSRFSWPSSHHERKLRNAHSATHMTKRERKASKMGVVKQ